MFADLEAGMIPHRLPPGVPIELLHSAERQALADHGGNDWANACRDAGLAALTSPDASLIREMGLTASALRPGRNLGKRSLGDDSLGRQVLTQLAGKMRGER